MMAHLGKYSVFMAVICGSLLISTRALAQGADASLEQRVQALEEYASSIQPALAGISDSLNAGIQQYTQGLESSLEGYSKNLQSSIDRRLSQTDRKTVVLNPFSGAYQSIETNTGTFLISVEKVEKIDAGVRLHINVGNPNYADYNDFTLKLMWGKKWVSGPALSYEDWLRSLKGVEVTFNGKLEKGKWNSVIVDLTPVGEGELGYLECEMDVKSIELGISGY